MGFRAWTRRLYIRVREKLNLGRYRDGRYDDFYAVVYFTNGACMQWQGRPWGSQYERFKEMMDVDEVYSATANMNGEFWRYW
jgi:hypothetical protein